MTEVVRHGGLGRRRSGDSVYRVYGPDFQIVEHHRPAFGSSQTVVDTEQRGWWQQAATLEYACQLAREHGDGLYVIVRFNQVGIGAVRWARDKEGGQGLYRVADGKGSFVQALT